VLLGDCESSCWEGILPDELLDVGPRLAVPDQAGRVWRLSLSVSFMNLDRSRAEEPFFGVSRIRDKGRETP
jgi:hypothetical protein